MSEVIVTGDPADVLTALGVGSSLTIALFDPRLKIGGLARPVLPLAFDDRAAQRRDTRYVGGAIDEMLERLAALGSRGGLEARLVGGANMFPGLRDDMGQLNVACARMKLKQAGIPIVGESVGGDTGRSVRFAPSSGSLTIKTKL